MASREASETDHPSTSAHTHVLARELAVAHEIVPRLVAAREQLGAFARAANARMPEVDLDYDIARVGTLRVNRLVDFRVTADDRSRPTSVILAYEALGNHPLTVIPPTAESFFEIRSSLKEAGFEYTSAVAGNVGKVTVAPKVPVRLHLAADGEAGVIHFSARNLDGVTLMRYRLKPARVDIELLGEIERLAVHAPNRFRELTGNALGARALGKLREALRTGPRRS